MSRPGRERSASGLQEASELPLPSGGPREVLAVLAPQSALDGARHRAPALRLASQLGETPLHRVRVLPVCRVSGSTLLLRKLTVLKQRNRVAWLFFLTCRELTWE